MLFCVRVYSLGLVLTLQQINTFVFFQEQIVNHIMHIMLKMGPLFKKGNNVTSKGMRHAVQSRSTKQCHSNSQ